MKKEYLFIISGLVVCLLIGVTYAVVQKTSIPTDQNNQEQEAPSSPIVGGDRDEHGCIGSAGYSWCEEKNKCLRIWEETCGTEVGDDSVTSTTTKEETPVVQEPTIVGNPGESSAMCKKNSGVWYAGTSVCEINSLSASSCVAQGGVFDPCASACRHNPKAEMCTMQCVLTCTFE